MIIVAHAPSLDRRGARRRRMVYVVIIEWLSCEWAVKDDTSSLSGDSLDSDSKHACICSI